DWIQLNTRGVNQVACKVEVSVRRISGDVESDRTNISCGRSPVKLESRTAFRTNARAGRSVLDEGKPGGTGFGRTVLANHLCEVVDGTEISSLAFFEIAI